MCSSDLNFFSVKLPIELEKNAILLYETLGVHDIAWEYKDVLKVIEYLYTKSVVILGGDVLLKKIDGYKFTGDNWSEDSGDLEKSYQLTMQFINDYYRKRGDSYIYSLVCKREIHLF